MALLFIDSFDHYQTADLNNKWTDGFPSARLETGVGRCGTNALVMGFNQVIKGLVFGSLACTIGHAFKIGPISSGSVPVGGYVGNSHGAHCRLGWNEDGSLEVFGPSGSVCRSDPGMVHQDQWYFLEQQYLIHATAGAVTVRLNDQPLMAASGVPTASGEVVLRHVGFQAPSNIAFYVDDLYVLDSTGPAPLNTFLGDVHVEYLRPRGPGARQEWTPHGSTAHWVVVDDNATPDGDTTHISADTPGLTDTNVYQPTGLPSGPIFGLQVSPYAKKSEIGPRVLAPVVNGVTGNAFAPSYQDYAYFTRPYGTNPATGAAWTIATVNAVQAGVTVIS